jgi:hypothetical protein
MFHIQNLLADVRSVAVRAAKVDKLFWAIGRVNWLKIIDVSGTTSVPISRM